MPWPCMPGPERNDRRDWDRYLRADIQSLLFREGLAYLEAMDENVIVAPKAGEPITVGPYSPELVAKLFWKERRRTRRNAPKLTQRMMPCTHPRMNSSPKPFFSWTRKNGKKRSSCSPKCCAWIPWMAKPINKDPLGRLLWRCAGQSGRCRKGRRVSAGRSESFTYAVELCSICANTTALLDFTRYLQEETYAGADSGRIASVYYLRGVASSKLNDSIRGRRLLACHSAPLDLGRRTRPSPMSMTGWANQEAEADREEAGRLGGSAET